MALWNCSTGRPAKQPLVIFVIFVANDFVVFVASKAA
jgi:hypothetical protein